MQSQHPIYQLQHCRSSSSTTLMVSRCFDALVCIAIIKLVKRVTSVYHLLQISPIIVTVTFSFYLFKICHRTQAIAATKNKQQNSSDMGASGKTVSKQFRNCFVSFRRADGVTEHSVDIA